MGGLRRKQRPTNHGSKREARRLNRSCLSPSGAGEERRREKKILLKVPRRGVEEKRPMAVFLGEGGGNGEKAEGEY